MAARIEFYRDKKKEWRWRAWSENNKKVADSGEGYENREDCVDGAKVAMRVLTSATLTGLDT